MHAQGPAIYVNYSPEYPLASVFVDLFNRKMEGVTYYRGHLENEEYFSILNRCNIVLFPYNREVYRYMPSGLLREALAAGKVLVIPQGTSLARQARSVNAGAVTFEDFNAESVIQALHAALAQYDSLQNKACEAAVRWSKLHNPDRFMKQLLEQATAAMKTG
jgi:glycosyltransferase involved in cell wall biosynthesis